MYTGEEKAMNELEKLVIRMNSPRAVIDNVDCPTATLVKVDGEFQDSILFETVQMLSNLNLLIKKAYISTDVQWLMYVFYVTDLNGQKLLDKNVLSYIERFFEARYEPAAVPPIRGSFATFELTGADRPGLLLDIFSVLSDLGCRVVDAKLWTHIGRIAAIISVEEEGGKPIDNPVKRLCIKAYLWNVVKGGSVDVSSSSITYADHRLHQLMCNNHDYGLADAPSVSIEKLTERGYSTVIVQCPDRPKLLFDVTCILTDMNYVVFHGNIDTTGDHAYLELFIRHTEGNPINSDAERQKVILGLQAAIDRRSSQDLRLELRAPVHHHRFLLETTKTLRESGHSVTMAEVSPKGRKTVFYVAGIDGKMVDQKTIDSIIEQFGTYSSKISHGLSNDSSSCKMQPTKPGIKKSNFFRLPSLGSWVKQSLFNFCSMFLKYRLFKLE